MRVAIVTESFLPSANGVTTSVLRVLDHLKKHGHEALVICPGPAPSEYRGFKVVELEATQVRGFRAALPNLKLQRQLAAFAPDVLHAASPFVLGAQALLAANRLGIPTVAIFQTDVAGFARHHKLAITYRAAWRWLSVVHNSADLTLAPSSATLDDLRKWGFERTAYWGRGVDTQLFDPARRDSEFGRGLRSRIKEGHLAVGYVGRLAQEKSVERIVPLAQIPGVQLVIVGAGPSKPELERQLEGTGAIFTGRLDGEELAAAYASLDVFVHTGTQETFGQTLQEAMASKLPVIAPASGGPLDIVDHSVTGLLYTAGDQRSLNKAVKSVVDDEDTRLAMGQAGYDKVSGRSWDVVCGQLMEYYDCVITQRTPDLAGAS